MKNYYFENEFINFTELDLYELEKEPYIHDHFLEGCIHLKFLNFNPLKKLKSIGCYFLKDCFSLQEIDLSSLNKVEYIGYGFLMNCVSIQTIKVKKNSFIHHYLKYNYLNFDGIIKT